MDQLWVARTLLEIRYNVDEISRESGHIKSEN